MESSLTPLKYVIGHWTCHGTNSVYIKKKMYEWPWNLRSPKDLFLGLHYPLSWSNKFCAGRGKRGYLVAKCQGIMVEIFLSFFLFTHTHTHTHFHGYEERRGEGQTWFPPHQNCLLWTNVYQKNQHIHSLMHGHFSWSTFGLHLVRGSKASNMHFQENNHESETMRKCPLTWDNFMVHDVNNL